MKKMKRLLNAGVLLFALLVAGCSGNGKKEKTEDLSKGKTIQPVVQVKVKKIYDDQGNLIGMDSLYVWSYSNTEGDTTLIDPDSLLAIFRPLTTGVLPDSLIGPADPFFAVDSLFFHDFFREDYFFDRFHSEFSGMERILHELDSIKKTFLQGQYPGLFLP